MLSVEDVEVSYGDVRVLKGVSLSVNEGEMVALIGSNGSGKSTAINAISGLLKPSSGTITYDGTQIGGMAPHLVVARGIGQIPEGRDLFPDMTVQENLEMGAYLIRDRGRIDSQMCSVHSLFPILKERQRQRAGTLSGGEQQMLAVGRALMAEPKLLMFDEPSLGLAPLVVKTIFEIILRIRSELGVSVLLVEQNVKNSCRICDRACVLEDGRVALEGTGTEILNSPKVRQVYLGL